MTLHFDTLCDHLIRDMSANCYDCRKHYAYILLLDMAKLNDRFIDLTLDKYIGSKEPVLYFLATDMLGWPKTHTMDFGSLEDMQFIRMSRQIAAPSITP